MSQPRPDDLPTQRPGAQGVAPTDARGAVARKILQQINHTDTLDAPLGETLVREGSLSREQLSTALDAQRHMSAAGLPMRLGQVLVAKRMLTVDQVKHALALLGKTVLHCAACGKNFNVKNWRPGATVSCPTCAVPLTPPPADRALAAHATKVLPPHGLEDERATSGQPFGRYRLLEKLGQGGMGVVWKAWDTQLKRVVALKQILGGETDPETAERFLREAQAAARLKHPNIVGVHDVGVIEGSQYFTTDYVEGQPLDKVMRGEPIGERKALDLVRAVAEALAYAHEQGIVHRDIKPQNILVDGRGTPFVVDFGLAKDVKKELGRNLTVTGQVLGTPAYMSPEQAQGLAETLGPASDQFSLGVVMYEMITGKRPFESTSLGDLLLHIISRDPARPTQVDPRVHRDVETICLRAMEKDPSRRYASMSEFAADVARHLQGEPILARPVSAAERLWRRAKKNRALVLTAATALLMSLGSIAWISWTSHELRVKVRDGLAEAENLERERKWDKARDKYAAVKELNPRNEEARSGYDRAVGEIRRAEEALTSRATQAEAGRGAAEAERGALEESARLTEAARLSLDQSYRQRYDGAFTYADLSAKVQAATAIIDGLVQKRPDSPQGHFLRGRAWRVLEANDKAEACWHESLRCDASFAAAQYELGMMHLERAIERATVARPVRSESEDTSRAAPLFEQARKELEVAAAASWPGKDDTAERLLSVALAYLAGDEGRMRELYGSYWTAHEERRLTTEQGAERFFALSALGMWGGARVATLDRAIEVAPHDVLARFLRAAARCDQGDLDGALADYDEAIAWNSQLAEALFNRHFVRLEAADTAGAGRDYDAATSVDPGLRDFAGPEDRDALDRARVSGILVGYLQSVQVGPGSAEASVERGIRKARHGDLEGAVMDFDEAIGVNSGEARALNNRGVVRWAKGNVRDAIADLESAVSLDPQSAAAFCNLGFACCVRAADSTGMRTDLARSSFERAKGILPWCPEAWYGLGLVSCSKMPLDRPGAIEALDRAIALEPRYVEALAARGRARFETKDLTGAIEDYDSVLALRPRDVEAYLHRGIARSDHGDAGGAAADYEHARALDATIARTYADRARAGEEGMDPLGRLSSVDIAVALNPEDDALWAARGSLRETMSDWDGAIADYTAALAISPRSVRVLLLRARVHEKQKDRDEAIKDYKRALDVAPPNSDEARHCRESIAALEPERRPNPDGEAGRSEGSTPPPPTKPADPAPPAPGPVDNTPPSPEDIVIDSPTSELIEVTKDRPGARTPNEVVLTVSGEVKNKGASVAPLVRVSVKVAHLRALTPGTTNVVMILKGDSGEDQLKDLKPGESRPFQVRVVLRKNADVTKFTWNTEYTVHATLR